MLTDSFGRQITYLRLAVTDRCNLRCRYCMPAEGLDWLPRKDMLTYEEMLVLLQIFSELGISKLRFTGGEPFLRRDFMTLVNEVMGRNLFESVSITTNGTLTGPHVHHLKDIGIASINLSLDTLDPQRYASMTRRDDFEVVMETFYSLVEAGIPTRINAVILEGINEEDILPLAKLTKQFPVDVRFIEEMPFNGAGDRHAMRWNYRALEQHLREEFPELQSNAVQPHSTSMDYSIPGHLGSVGIIAAWSRTFCGSCNRIRLTPRGTMKTCLYSGDGLDLRNLLRTTGDEGVIREAIRAAIRNKEADGHAAESQRSDHPVSESMATIGG